MEFAVRKRKVTHPKRYAWNWYGCTLAPVVCIILCYRKPGGRNPKSGVGKLRVEYWQMGRKLHLLLRFKSHTKRLPTQKMENLTKPKS